jgi:hypothetical protein
MTFRKRMPREKTLLQPRGFAGFPLDLFPTLKWSRRSNKLASDSPAHEQRDDRAVFMNPRDADETLRACIKRHRSVPWFSGKVFMASASDVKKIGGHRLP